MATKTDVIKKLQVKTYSYNEIKHLMETITTIDEQDAPKKIMIGDVIKIQSNKPRPAVVIAVRKGFCVYATLSSTENSYNLVKGESRFFGDSFINKQVSICTEEIARTSFIGVYGNRAKVREVKKELKRFYKGILL